jgi:hypothetical protein
MERYEYRSFLCKGEPGKQANPLDFLNKIGEDGWIMIHMEVSPQRDRIVIVAYRKKV